VDQVIWDLGILIWDFVLFRVFRGSDLIGLPASTTNPNHETHESYETSRKRKIFIVTPSRSAITIHRSPHFRYRQ
jgi:hypothetical protein